MSKNFKLENQIKEIQHLGTKIDACIRVITTLHREYNFKGTELLIKSIYFVKTQYSILITELKYELLLMEEKITNEES